MVSNQPSLFDTRERVGSGGATSSTEPRVSRVPYAKNSDTSKHAADFIKGKVPSLRARVLLEITKRGSEGATADELCIALGACRNSVAPRLCELGPGSKRFPGLSLIVDSGRRRKIAGQNVSAVVWIQKGVQS